jgi:hypothetical protein
VIRLGILSWGGLTWIIPLGPESNHKCPSKRKAEGELAAEEEEAM